MISFHAYQSDCHIAVYLCDIQFTFTSNFLIISLTMQKLCKKRDRAKRHEFLSRFLLFINFSSSLFLGGKRITKVVIKSHAFLLDQKDKFIKDVLMIHF